MGKATTTKRINPAQLQQHLGAETMRIAGDPDSDGSKEIEVDGMSQSAIQQGLSTYVHDRDFGRNPSDQRMAQLRQKARAVIDSGDTFTAAQMQQIVARLVLRQLGEDD